MMSLLVTMTFNDTYNLSIRRSKTKYLTDEISTNLQLKLKGLLAQQYNETEHEIKSMRSNIDQKVIKYLEKEISYLKRQLANTNPLILNLRSKILLTRRCTFIGKNRGN